MLPGMGLLPSAVRAINDQLFTPTCLTVLWPCQHEHHCAVCEKRKAIFGIQLSSVTGGLSFQVAREGIRSPSRFQAAGVKNGWCGPELDPRPVRQHQRGRRRELQLVNVPPWEPNSNACTRMHRAWGRRHKCGRCVCAYRALMSLASLGSDGRADMAGMQEWSRLLADLIPAFQDLKGTGRKAGRDFVRVQEETGCGEMPSKWRSRLRVEIGKKFFPVRMGRQWHRLPSQAVDAPSLEARKALLQGRGEGRKEQPPALLPC